MCKWFACSSFSFSLLIIIIVEKTTGNENNIPGTQKEEWESVYCSLLLYAKSFHHGTLERIHQLPVAFLKLKKKCPCIWICILYSIIFRPKVFHTWHTKILLHLTLLHCFMTSCFNLMSQMHVLNIKLIFWKLQEVLHIHCCFVFTAVSVLISVWFIPVCIFKSFKSFVYQRNRNIP